MRRWKSGVLCGLIFIFLSIINTTAFGNQIISLQQKDDTEIMANKDIDYIIQTDGYCTAGLYIEVMDEEGNIVQEENSECGEHFLVGMNYEFKLNVPKTGNYTLHVDMKRVEDGLTIDEKTLEITCEEDYNEEKDRKIAYLTFDDGPSLNTLKILDILEKYDIKATFFVLGKKVEKNKDTLKLIHEKGHVIGNHTYSHDYDYLYKKFDNFIGEIHKNEELIESILGEYDTKMIRFPGGSFRHKEYRNAMDELGYKHYNWNVDSGDSRASLVAKDNIVKTVMDTLWYKHVIILFHDATGKNTTPDAVEEIIIKLKEKGYEFDSLKEDTMDSF